MFEHISLRPTKDQTDATISAEVQMARKGANGRLLFAVVIGLSSLLWLEPIWSAAYVCAIFAWELWGRPWSTVRAVAALKSKGDLLRHYHRAIIFAIACLYSIAPLTGIFSGELVGWYVAMMAFCSAIISGVTYFSNDKWQFAASTLPSFLIATVAPLVYGVPMPIAVVVLLLNAMFTLSALQSAVHRGELVESISKEEAARSRAENANVEKSQFIANVSHELRSPLNAIIGYSELLRESAEEESRASDQADLDKVLMASRRLLHLVNELLDISKVEAGKLALNVGWFDASEMIEAAVAAARPLAETNGAAISVEIDPGLGQGVSDEFRLSQCVLNLIANVTTQGSAITLRARRITDRGGDWFVIEAAGGEALDETTLDHLFDPFARAESGSEASGVSLGLAITRRIARLLGGDVTAENRPGEGSVFTLHTPVVARLRDGQPAAAAPGAVRAA